MQASDLDNNQFYRQDKEAFLGAMGRGADFIGKGVAGIGNTIGQGLSGFKQLGQNIGSRAGQGFFGRAGASIDKGFRQGFKANRGEGVGGFFKGVQGGLDSVKRRGKVYNKILTKGLTDAQRQGMKTLGKTVGAAGLLGTGAAIGYNAMPAKQGSLKIAQVEGFREGAWAACEKLAYVYGLDAGELYEYYVGEKVAGPKADAAKKKKRRSKENKGKNKSQRQSAAHQGNAAKTTTSAPAAEAPKVKASDVPVSHNVSKAEQAAMTGQRNAANAAEAFGDLKAQNMADEAADAGKGLMGALKGLSTRNKILAGLGTAGGLAGLGYGASQMMGGDE